MLDAIEKNLLKEVAELDSLPVGAYNIRANGQLDSRNTTANIDIVTKADKPGIDIYIKPGTKNESVHIPVIISKAGLKDLVYNDFHIGEDADVTIIAGCGIHGCGGGESQHDGIHTFYLGKNARLRYVEKHYGEGDEATKRVMNPTTIVHLEEGAQMEMETTQIAGIDDTIRKTSGTVAAGASLVVKEKIMTTGVQNAVTDFVVDLNGDGSAANIVSRSVARDHSRQEFISRINGNCECTGHSECDAIIMDDACVLASPQLTANSVDATLIHEAAIGKIAGEQLIKLMTLGLTEQQAEEQIARGFLESPPPPRTPVAGRRGEDKTQNPPRRALQPCGAVLHPWFADFFQNGSGARRTPGAVPFAPVIPARLPVRRPVPAPPGLCRPAVSAQPAAGSPASRRGRRRR